MEMGVGVGGGGEEGRGPDDACDYAMFWWVGYLVDV